MSGDAVRIVGLALVYVIVARLGLMLDAVAGFATLVWPASGISLAALIRFGPRLWPGVAIGAFVANVLTGAPIAVALGICAGNTLEAVAGAWALRRVPGFRGGFDVLREALGLVAFAAVASTMLSATIGVTSLRLGGIVAGDVFAETWRAWWVGDLIGDLVVAPLLLVWSTARPPHDPPRRSLEALGLAVAVVAVSVVIYDSRTGTESGTSMFRHGYVFFPLLMWAALRFGPRETITATFVVAAIALMGTATGRGPFVQPSLHQSLFGLQTFIAVAAATFLVLGASIAERRRTASELEATQKDLERAVDARDALISVASHELRTPLSALQLQVHLIERHLGKRPEEQVSEPPLGTRLAVIHRQVGRLTRLIDNLLDVSRVTAGKLRLEYERVDLGSTVREVVARFEDEARRAGSSLSLRSQDDVAGRWDRLRIEQIATNLISNAVKYGQARPIEVIVEGTTDRGRLVVVDHGIGIAERDQARIFERYERLADTNAGGFGLGLWIVREIVRALGGTIRVESQPGTGTTFTVELPKAHEERLSAGEVRPTTRPSAH
jgi:signal transduction histidine kinase